MNFAPLTTLALSEYLPTAVEPPPLECGTDVMADAALWLADQLHAHTSRPVTYCRGATEVALCATVGRSAATQEDIYGALRVIYTDRDYLIPASQLLIEGVATLPMEGDRIKEDLDGAIVEFAVVASEGEPAWRYSDPHGRMLRIHTKEIESDSTVAAAPAACGLDLMDGMALWLADQMSAHASRPITYSQGQIEIKLCATVGRTASTQDDIYGALRVIYTDRDYLIPTASLRYGGQPVLPAAGDRIQEDVAGRLMEFEVAASEGEPAWRYSDPQRRILRVHTKQIESALA
jgi:hypothetical protein